MKQLASIFVPLMLVMSMTVLRPQSLYGQYDKEGYTLEAKLKMPRVRKPEVQELMLDPHNRFLIVTFSTYPTHVLFYDLKTWELAKEYMIPEWFDLSSSFFDTEGRYFFISYGRFSSKYRRIDLTTDEISVVECWETPRGCLPKENAIPKKEIYTIDRTYYIIINRLNNKEVLVFKKN